MPAQISFFKSEVRFTFRNRDAIRTWVGRVIKKHKGTATSINFIFVTDKALRAVNAQYLNHDYNTDVVTFPLNEPGEPIEGEVYISIDTIKSNSKRFKVSFEEELHRVIIHGVLHLLGYDDQTEALKLRMKTLEDAALSLRQFHVEPAA